MGKLLRVLVIVILVLSLVALVFANMLFGKRELLMRRNNALEDLVVRVAQTIEAADAPAGTAPDLQKDISAVSDRELANPERDAVLQAYPIHLEQQNLPTLDFRSTDKRMQLRSFYVVDAEGNYVLDPLDNRPATKGPGSMQELLDQVFERAKAQQATLNQTRSELAKLRDLLTSSVTEINQLKRDARTTRRELTEARGQIAALQTEKEALESRVTRLTAEKRELTAELADAKNEVERLNEEKVTITEELAAAQKLNQELKSALKGRGAGPAARGVVAVPSLSAGDKGRILEMNDELKFAIVEFSDDAMDEMLGPDRANPLPQFEMNVRRPGLQSAAGEFVTRIKLRQSVRGKNLVVVDILADWQQVPVEKGDVVFF